MNTASSFTPIAAFPIHGHHKLRNEGYRTRDGHVIEWAARLIDNNEAVRVISRPEPLVRSILIGRRNRPANDLPKVSYADPLTIRLPTSTNRAHWWVASANYYSRELMDVEGRNSVIWNPLLGLSTNWSRLVASSGSVHMDLLDDWTKHYAFDAIRTEVDKSYRRIFETCSSVSANSEGTLALAHRYGRTDAALVLNGCDPERFTSHSTACGPVTVGYVGKIGDRLDIPMIVRAAEKNPQHRFIFAGPILDGDFESIVSKYTNITWLGDVHYDNVPALLQTFDIGWVPHRVGEGEVGGDVIKTYEYRAAGLPVLATPIIGINDRGFEAVTVLDSRSHPDHLSTLAVGPSARVERVPSQISEELTWRHKTVQILNAMNSVRR